MRAASVLCYEQHELNTSTFCISINSCFTLGDITKTCFNIYAFSKYLLRQTVDISSLEVCDYQRLQLLFRRLGRDEERKPSPHIPGAALPIPQQEIVAIWCEEKDVIMRSCESAEGTKDAGFRREIKHNDKRATFISFTNILITGIC